MEQRCDVCIFGAGPAGAATGLRLARLGVAVVVCERRLGTKPWGGESFSGAVREPLAALGLWEGFRAAGHVAGYEHRSQWGAAGTGDSIFNPYGHAWHVDRDRFDADLRAALGRSGVEILAYDRLGELRREGERWRVGLDDGRALAARFLVDATGRARAVARRLGVRPRIHDRLIAMTAVVPRNPAFDHAMVIQTTPAGWWYAAPVPQGHVLAYFTDSDLKPRELAGRMRVVAANSAFSRPRSPDGWLAVGDACAAHDPLCGWGVHRALENGLAAADAIGLRLMAQDASGLDAYERCCRDQYDAYLAGLAEHYGYERRWAEFPFWRRRLRATIH